MSIVSLGPFSRSRVKRSASDWSIAGANVDADWSRNPSDSDGVGRWQCGHGERREPGADLTWAEVELLGFITMLPLA